MMRAMVNYRRATAAAVVSGAITGATRGRSLTITHATKTEHGWSPEAMPRIRGALVDQRRRCTISSSACD
jgi:hypothetical protein